MTYRFVGPQGPVQKIGCDHAHGLHGKNKGVMRGYRSKLRMEAEVRDEELPQDSPRRHRNRLAQSEYELAV